MSDERYAPVDAGIHAWAERHQLHLCTEYKDYEVRSFNIPHAHKNFQIWIDPPENNGAVSVHGWDRKNSRIERRLPAQEIISALEEVLHWIRTRT